MPEKHCKLTFEILKSEYITDCTKNVFKKVVLARFIIFNNRFLEVIPEHITTLL